MTDTIQLRKRLWEKKKTKQFQQFSWRSSSARKISESASFSFVYSQHSNNPSAKGNHPEWKMNVRPFMGMDSTTQSKKNRNYKKNFQTDLRHYYILYYAKRRKRIIRLDFHLAWFRLMVEINYSSSSFNRMRWNLEIPSYNIQNDFNKKKISPVFAKMFHSKMTARSIYGLV